MLGLWQDSFRLCGHSTNSERGREPVKLREGHMSIRRVRCPTPKKVGPNAEAVHRVVYVGVGAVHPDLHLEVSWPPVEPITFSAESFRRKIAYPLGTMRVESPYLGYFSDCLTCDMFSVRYHQPSHKLGEHPS